MVFCDSTLGCNDGSWAVDRSDDLLLALAPNLAFAPSYMLPVYKILCVSARTTVGASSRLYSSAMPQKTAVAQQLSTPEKKQVAASSSTPKKLPVAVTPDEALLEKAQKIAAQLQEMYAQPPIPLEHSSPYQLLVAVILSAQTTDKKVTPTMCVACNASGLCTSTPAALF